MGNDPSRPAAREANLADNIREENGVIIVVAQDFPSPEAMAAHMTELNKLTARIRKTFGKTRMLVDLREAAVLSSQALGELESAKSANGSGMDRVAVLTKPGLVKMQNKRLHQPANQRMFEDMDAARAWLDE